MQKYVLTWFFVCLLPLVIYAYPWAEERDGLDRETYDDDAMQLFNNIERRQWCAKWGDFCRPDAKIKYAQCCPGLRCMCGHFWTQGKCQCKSKGTFGK